MMQQFLSTLFDLALTLGWLALLVAALSYARTRLALKWSMGLNAALFGFGVLLCVTSPAPVGEEWFTGQQVLGAGLGLLAAGIFGLSVIVAGLVSLVNAHGVRAQGRARVQHPLFPASTPW
jgi:hypothetical protein